MEGVVEELGAEVEAPEVAFGSVNKLNRGRRSWGAVDSTVGNDCVGGDEVWALAGLGLELLLEWALGSLPSECALFVIVVSEVMVAVDLDEKEERDLERGKVNDEPDEPERDIDARAVTVDAVSEERDDARPLEDELFRSLNLPKPLLPGLRGSFAFLPFACAFVFAVALLDTVAVSSEARSSNKLGPSNSLSLDNVTIGGGGGGGAVTVL